MQISDTKSDTRVATPSKNHDSTPAHPHHSSATPEPQNLALNTHSPRTASPRQCRLTPSSPLTSSGSLADDSTSVECVSVQGGVVELEGGSGELEGVQCHLETRDLWEKFHDLGTEMIITKSGR